MGEEESELVLSGTEISVITWLQVQVQHDFELKEIWWLQGAQKAYPLSVPGPLIDLFVTQGESCLGHIVLSLEAKS